ncbi:TIGR02391 family protein [Candidatus Poribacteria bacterium]|nr:TIGR02391 family protein [Candidatus Poribacteria bacterium]
MKIPLFREANLEQLCNVLGDTTTGLTGSEIGRYLHELGIHDPMPGITKRVRLYEALVAKQRADACANNVCAFVQRVMNPVLHVQSPGYFECKQAELNRVIAFEGFRLNDEGKFERCKQAKTISDAEEAADRLRRKLLDRGVHSDVLRFCRAELVDGNYFHAVLEAAKSVAEKIREMTGLTSDGSDLVDDAFGIGKKKYPLVAFNALSTDSELSEHKGLVNLMKGFFGTFRNPTAHAPKIDWKITEQDALDMMTLSSLLHRRLDGAAKTGGE